jgi:hypothetical protein
MNTIKDIPIDSDEPSGKKILVTGGKKTSVKLSSNALANPVQGLSLPLAQFPTTLSSQTCSSSLTSAHSMVFKRS